jgi:hypothetical protein
MVEAARVMPNLAAEDVTIRGSQGEERDATKFGNGADATFAEAGGVNCAIAAQTFDGQRGEEVGFGTGGEDAQAARACEARGCCRGNFVWRRRC